MDGKEIEVLLTYVNDVPIFANTIGGIKKVKQNLSSTFKIKDLGELKYILGVRVRRDFSQKRFHLDQEVLIT